MNLDNYDVSKFSPMMKQYIEIKKDYTDDIVFFRLGDFYEMFFEDAFIASKILELQLTGKDCGQEERVPMCGIPFHAYEIYALKLIDNGYKVAIVEQVEDPKQAKGIVKRDVVRILTPGTCVIGELQNKENKFLAAIKAHDHQFVLSYVDVLTGNIYLTDLDSFDSVVNELLNIEAKEVLYDNSLTKKQMDALCNNYPFTTTMFSNYDIPSYLAKLTSNLESKLETNVVGMLVNYILRTQREQITHLKNIEKYEYYQYLKLDMHSKRNLELVETIRLGSKNGSLLYLLDNTKTAMGSRMLNRWINYPLIDIKMINRRQDNVEAFFNDEMLTKEVENYLKGVYDLERIVGKISCDTCNAKDLAQLKITLANVSQIKDMLVNSDNSLIKELGSSIDSLYELYQLLDEAILDNPSILLRDGKMIKPSYNKDLAELYEIKNHSHEWLKNYEALEKEKSGIKNLKIGYNKVFGYYIEITKSNLNEGYLENYERKQTLVNAERFITPELKDFEVKVLSASERIVDLEYELFNQIKQTVSNYTITLQKNADILSEIDCYISLANVAKKYRYIRPEFNNKNEMTIIDGRHPVLYELLKNDYVSNDIFVNKFNTLLITGPNMSGKSTYMRMVALISIMAQMGSFVPATKANLPIFDQIFTRIGASDDLNSGQSTFMVEMTEANYALKNATKNSLILFDEIGRGTATYDGLALAQAIIEYVHEKIGCITLFSTHYHELVELEKSLSRLKNIHVDAKEENGKIIFLHKVKDGPIDKSYGINVAELAKLPKSLVIRAKEILNNLETDSKHSLDLNLFDFESYEDEQVEEQIDTNYEIIEELQGVDINNLTPLEAFNIIIKLKSML